MSLRSPLAREHPIGHASIRHLVSLAALVALAAGCSGGGTASSDAATDDLTALDPATAVTASTAAAPTTTITVITGQQIDILTLKVGDCFNRYRFVQNNNPVDLTTKLDCTQPHDHELIHRADHPAGAGAPYPGKDVLNRFATKACYDQFEPYVGAPYETSTLDLAFVLPPQANWENNRYRGVLCFVTPRDRANRLVAPVRSSGR